MYIKHNSIQYPCGGRRERLGTVVFTGCEGLPEAISGTLELMTDEGFFLADYDTGDFMRVEIAGGTLTLTDEPVPEPTPEPPPPGTVITMEDVAETLLDHEVEIAALKMGVK